MGGVGYSLSKGPEAGVHLAGSSGAGTMNEEVSRREKGRGVRVGESCRATWASFSFQ